LIARGDSRWFRFAKPEWIRIVERAYLGPWIATIPDARWPEIRAALLDVLGFEPCAEAVNYWKRERTFGWIAEARPRAARSAFGVAHRVHRLDQSPLRCSP
jgi:hypothetical protein